MSIDQLKAKLEAEKVDFEILKQSKEILSNEEEAKEFGASLSQLTPTLVFVGDGKHLAVIKSGHRKLNLKQLACKLGVQELKLATKEQLQKLGFKIGLLPMIGLCMPIHIEKRVLKERYVYGGCGIPYYCLKISTNDLLKLTDAKIIDLN